MTLSLHFSRVISAVGESVRARASIPATSPACQDLVDIIDNSHELVPFGPRGLLSNEFVYKIRYSISIKLIASYYLYNAYIIRLTSLHTFAGTTVGIAVSTNSRTESIASDKPE